MVVNIKVSTKSSYNVKVVKSIADASFFVSEEASGADKIFLIIDKNIPEKFLDELVQGIKTHPLVIIRQEKVGECLKTIESLNSLAESILKHRPTRNSILIACGGGCVGDLVGFTASILLRGVRYIQVPTTLLAMVDSSVGGKTAINTSCGKNMLGSFWQPKAVVCAMEFLGTLPKREFLCGYAEILKHAIIDRNLLEYLTQKVKEISARDKETLAEVIARNIQIKANIVSLDEREGGVRAILNFGHTFAHALEKHSSLSGLILHGEAVAIGIIAAIKYSIVSAGVAERQEMNRLIEAVTGNMKEIGVEGDLKGFMTKNCIAHPTDWEKFCDEIVTLMCSDKKNSSSDDVFELNGSLLPGKITLILPTKDSASVNKDVSTSNLRSCLPELLCL